MLTKKEWLEERRNHIGASEVAAILGLDPRYGPIHVYTEKTQGVSKQDAIWLEYGHAMEAPIGNIYSKLTGRKIVDLGATTIQRHPDIPYLAATLDRQVFGSEEHPGPDGDVPGACEIKYTDLPHLKPEHWHETNSDLSPFIIQNQVQMACTGWTWGSIVGKFPYYQVSWFDQMRDDELFEEVIYPAIDEFWERVKRGDPPPSDETPSAAKALKQLYPRDTGETITVDQEGQRLFYLWLRAKEDRKEADDAVKKYETRLREKMGDALYGALPDGTFLALPTTKVKGYTKTVDSYEYRKLGHTKKRK
jgi:predicted phage-related endonuclease